MKKIAYYERTVLRNRGAVDQAEDSEIDSLLVADVVICQYNNDHSRAGFDFNEIRPAWHRGEKCFLRTSSWCPENGYSAEGVEDRILSFEEGVKILIQENAYEWMWKLPKN